MVSQPQAPNHLVIVCCHGIWLGGLTAGHDESEWLIATFQKGETTTFIKHIKAGLEVVANDPAAILVFSGCVVGVLKPGLAKGPTRKETRTTEAESYSNVAVANSYFGLFPIPHKPRTLLECRALDSYHNMLFSLTLFRAHFDAWPAKVTVVSHAFKRGRIIDQNLVSAIRFPLRRLDFVGIDPPDMAGDGGIEQAIKEWGEDPHGVGPALAGKRARRNVWSVEQTIFPPSHGQPGRAGLGVKINPAGGEMLDDDIQRPWA